MARWPPGFTSLPIPTGPNRPSGAVYGVSADGKTAVGWATADTTTVDTYHQACYWTPTSGPVFIAPIGTTAWDVSRDGLVIIGGADTPDTATGTPFYWTASGGVIIFGSAGDVVNAISADASRIVGNTRPGGTTPQPCYWDISTLATVLLALPSGFNGGNATDVSADGSVIVGEMFLASGDPSRPFRWTAASGMVDLGYPPPAVIYPVSSAGASGVSDDGNTIVGIMNHTGTGTTSFVWTPTSYVDVGDTDIYGINAISGDGSTLYSYGWYPDVTHDLADHIAYTVNGHTIVPTPTLFPPPSNEPAAYYFPANNAISRDGLVMGGYCGAEPTLPFIYVAPGLAMDNVVIGSECVLCLDWSDDRGHTFGNPVCIPMGDSYLTSLQWQRLGYARDRVFRLTWTCGDHTALQGAWYTAIAERRRGNK